MATNITVGYSGTLLVNKLGIKPGFKVRVIDAPDRYLSWICPIPPGVAFPSNADSHIDLVHLFVIDKAKLIQYLSSLRKQLDPEAVIWVSWPKKASRLPTTVNEDTIREVALPLGLVDIKVCAVSDVWSGLKLVVRKELRR